MVEPLFETYARGKLLLTGEYFVLDGALALAVPVRFGQRLRVEAWKEPNRLSWTSKDHLNAVWFLGEYDLPDLDIRLETDHKTATILQDILRACRRQNPDFLAAGGGYKALTSNDFPKDWGLGTSSTLIAALARWAGVDPYRLLFETLGGSGYDIACAYADGPLLYRLPSRPAAPDVMPVDYAPPFAGNLYFVYLAKKQDSRLGIQRYRERAGKLGDAVERISVLTHAFLLAGTLHELDAVIREHEQLVAAVIDLPLVKHQFFPDFWGEVKSLGAWGGDFVLATSARGADETRAYFREKGFGVCLSWGEMII